MSDTDIFITVIVILSGLWELFALWTKRPTISRGIKRLGTLAPWIIFTVGYLCGHWFGFMPPEEKDTDKNQVQE